MTLVISHNAGLERAAAGSIEAFADTLESGCDAVEFDIRRAPHGTLVVSHDPVGPEDDPPRLEDVLTLLGHRLRCNLELKEAGYVEDVLAIAHRHLPPELILISSALDEVVAAVDGLDKGLVIGRRRDPVPTPEEIARRVRATGAGYLCTSQMLLPHGVLDTARELGTPPLVWTVNEEDALRELLDDERVAGVFTDYPRRAIALRDRRR